MVGDDALGRSVPHSGADDLAVAGDGPELREFHDQFFSDLARRVALVMPLSYRPPRHSRPIYTLMPHDCFAIVTSVDEGVMGVLIFNRRLSRHEVVGLAHC